MKSAARGTRSASDAVRLAGRVLALGGFTFLVGLLLVLLAEAEARWVVFVTAGIVLALGAVLTDVRRALLVYFVMALSVDAHYYLTTPRLPMFTGDTSPGALSIPLALIPGFALLAGRLVVSVLQGGASRFLFVPAFSVPAMAVIATASVSTLLAPMWFIGLCVVWQLGALYLLFLVTANEVRSERDANLVVTMLMVVLVGQCLVFLLQLATGIKFNAVGRVVSSADELWHSATGTAAITTAGFATFMQPLVALAYAKFRVEPPGARRSTYAVLAAIGALVIALTLNRSSLAGLPLGLVAVEVLLRRQGLVTRSRAFRRRMVVLGVVVGLSLLVGLSLMQSKRATNFWEDLDLRFSLMRPAFSMIGSGPVFGVGPGVYAYQLAGHAAGHEGWLYIIHNDYLLIWAERGTIGLIAWLLWVRATFALMLARTRSPGLATVGAGAAGGFVAHLWEVFWTAGMSFPAYGVIWVLSGVCAFGASTRLATGETQSEPVRHDANGVGPRAA